MRSWTKKADADTASAFLSLLKTRRSSQTAAMRIGTAQLLLDLSEQGAPSRECDSAIFTRQQVAVAKEARRILAEDLSRRRSIESVALELGVKPTSLKSCFKGVYGECISDHLAELRMRRSEDLLRNGSEPIAQIAREVGFANAGKFSAFFKERRGVAPLRYRKASRAEGQTADGVASAAPI